MKILDILTSPWAIQPTKLNEIAEIYSTHLKGEKIDLNALEEKLGAPLENRQQGYEVVDGVAIVPVFGVLAKRMNMFQKISGGSSMELLARDITGAIQDPEVKSIILDIDSPGGTVDGTADLGEVIYNARGDKPIVALANGVMASAAYWIGAAADEVYVANSTTPVGSIGVVSTHIDRSENLKQDGIKVTEIYAGKYKRLNSEYKPLSKEGKAQIQEEVDYLYSIFVETVAEYRGVDTEAVLEMADGQIFIGEQAVAAGLVDGVVALKDLVKQLVISDVNQAAFTQANQEELSDLLKQEDDQLDITSDLIREDYADIAQELIDEGAESVKVEEIALEAAEAERARISGVLEQSLPGHEKLVQELAFDGHTTPEQAAIAILKAERGVISDISEKMQADADEIPEVTATSEIAETPKSPQQRWESDAELRAEFNEDYDSFVAYERAIESGRVKILRG